MSEAWEVEVGDVVLFKPSPQYPQWFKMDVGDVGEDGVVSGLVFFFNEGGAGAGIKDGVRHVDDPKLRDPSFLANLVADGDSGVWKHTARNERYEARLKALERSGGVGEPPDEEDPAEVTPAFTLARRNPKKSGKKVEPPEDAEERGLAIGGNKTPRELAALDGPELTAEEKAERTAALNLARPRG